MISFSEELEAAQKLATGAGRILASYYQRAIDVDWKAPGDPVTAADREASEFIVSRLRQQFPEHAVLSEEEADDHVRLERSHVWMVDPMDGTREFIAHRDEFAVMIGLAVKGTPSVGVIYQPINGKLYSAVLGAGAFLEWNGARTPLHVSPETVASKLILAESRSHRSARVAAIRERLRIKHTIQSGSVGLKVGLICEGQAHLYVHAGNKTNVWDTCGPDVILLEAGGRMTDIRNEPLRYTDREVRNLTGLIASNGAIHDRAVQVTQAVVAGSS
jgi:3'(2'), 5'-bisphosphate nucleotidase